MPEKHEVLMVLYDLPTQTPQERRQYSAFRKSLLEMGFEGIQESVYIKLVRNAARMSAEMAVVRAAVPKKGTVYLLPLSLQAFRQMETALGNTFPMARFSDDLVVIMGNEPF